jgi:hypothetical protein
MIAEEMSDLRVEHYADFGSSEPWAARLGIGIPELVRAVPAFGKTREEFLLDFGDVIVALGGAFTDLVRLRALTAAGGPALDIERGYENLYGGLWQAYKDRFPRAMKTLGLDIGFLFQKDAAYERGSAELEAERPELADLLKLMRADREQFQLGLARYRNDYIEHRSTDEAQIEALRNDFHRLDSAENTFENVWQAIEDHVALYVIASLPAGIHVIPIPEEQRDPARPTRFQFAVDRELLQEDDPKLGP